MIIKKMLKNKYLPLYLLLIFIAVSILLLPVEAHAETIQETLRSNQNIKNLHTGFLNILNIPIILIVVVIAFAEMLHLKIDTYSFKKILPTLLLAIIAAQFSYLICKLIIDFANMTVTLFTDPSLLGDASGLPNAYKTTFEGLFPQPPDWTKFTYGAFFNILLNVLFLFIGSAEILVLCFIFIARSWMIYVLVIISSAAFMALALPQTKTYFNKWWTEFLKWAFMPVPAVFCLWLGATFLKSPIMAADWLPLPIVSTVLAGVCLYGAIAIPFKMGGVVMDKFWTYTGAKFLANNAKDYWTRRVKATTGLAWERFRKFGLNLQREGKTGFTRWLGRNWIGSGGAKLAADEAHLSRLQKGIDEGIQGRYNLGKGLDRTMEIEWIKNRNGEVAEYEAYGLEALQQLGIKDPNNPMWKQYDKWRAGSGMAAGRMAVVSSMDNAMRSYGQYLWLSGGGNQKDQESKEAFAKRKAAALGLLGTNQTDVDAFQQLLKLARSQEEAAKAGMEKMLNDASIKPDLEQCQLQERQLVFMMLNEIEGLMDASSDEVKELITYLQQQKKGLEQLTEAERRQHASALAEITKTTAMTEDEAAEADRRRNMVTKVMETSRRASSILAYQNILHEGELLVAGSARYAEARGKVNENRRRIIEKYNKQLRDQKRGYVDAYMRDMLHFNAAGEVDDISLMERVVYTRKKGISMGKTNSRAANDYAKRSPEETVSIFFGSDQKDGLTEELTGQLRNGEVILDANKESRIYANAEGLRYHLNSESDSERTADAILAQAPQSDVRAIASRWAEEEVLKGRPENATELTAAISSGDHEALKTVMRKIYKSFPKNSDRRHLNNAIDIQLLPGAAT